MKMTQRIKHVVRTEEAADFLDSMDQLDSIELPHIEKILGSMSDFRLDPADYSTIASLQEEELVKIIVSAIVSGSGISFEMATELDQFINAFLDAFQKHVIGCSIKGIGKINDIRHSLHCATGSMYVVDIVDLANNIIDTVNHILDLEEILNSQLVLTA